MTKKPTPTHDDGGDPTFTVIVDMREVAVRILAGLTGRPELLERPASSVLAEFAAKDDKDYVELLKRTSISVMEYIADQMEDGGALRRKEIIGGGAPRTVN